MFKPAICTQCGAQIKVDPNKEAAICPSCGTAFITEKAINNYEIQNATINVVINKNETSELESIEVFNRGLSHYKLKEYSEASKNFEKAIKLDPENAKYRIYSLASQTKGLTHFNMVNIAENGFFKVASDKDKKECSEIFNVDLSSEDNFLAYILQNAKIGCALAYFLSENINNIDEFSAKILLQLLDKNKLEMFGSNESFVKPFYNKIVKFVSKAKKESFDYNYYLACNLRQNGELYIRDENPFEKDGVLRVDDKRIFNLNFQHYTKNKVYNSSSYAPNMAKTIFDKKGADKLVITKNLKGVIYYSSFFDIIEIEDVSSLTYHFIRGAIAASSKLVILPNGNLPTDLGGMINGRLSTVIYCKGSPVGLPTFGYKGETFGYVSQGKIVYPKVDSSNNQMFFLKKFNEHLREFFGEEIKNGTLQGYIPDEKLGQKQGCYVATCVYGSYNCPEVWTLRRFRDYKLSKTAFGRAFIKTYYKISPKIVKVFGKTKWFNKLFKSILNRKVKRLKKKGYQDTPYNDLY